MRNLMVPSDFLASNEYDPTQLAGQGGVNNYTNLYSSTMYTMKRTIPWCLARIFDTFQIMFNGILLQYTTRVPCAQAYPDSQCCCVLTQNRQRVEPEIPIWLVFQDKSLNLPGWTGAGKNPVLAPFTAGASKFLAILSSTLGYCDSTVDTDVEDMHHIGGTPSTIELYGSIRLMLVPGGV